MADIFKNFTGTLMKIELRSGCLGNVSPAEDQVTEQRLVLRRDGRILITRKRLFPVNKKESEMSRRKLGEPAIAFLFSETEKAFRDANAGNRSILVEDVPMWGLRLTNDRNETFYYTGEADCFSYPALSNLYRDMLHSPDLFVFDGGAESREAVNEGVPVNKNGAARIILGMYEENLENFSNGWYDCKFADVALRMGGLYEKGIGVDEDLAEAYFYYLQADHAIKKRMEVNDCYGDRSVQKNITEALERCRMKLPKDFFKRQVTFRTPMPVGMLLQGSSGIGIEMECDESGKVFITVNRCAISDADNRILFTVPEADYCELTDRVKLRVEGARNISADLPVKVFVTEMDFNEDEHRWEFSHGDQVMLAFRCNGFTFTA